ncbi:conjugal transfer protein TraC [Candidatus Nomurabacteria bacterium]|nr:conjugal transfer protein TraC [Candidatus Nomurabacteria bacterium]
MLDTAYGDLENLRDNLMQAQAKMFDVGLYITVYADNENDLFKVESEIKSLLESKLIYLKPALFQQDEGFKSVIPLSTDLLGIHQKLDTEPLSSLFPFVSFDLTSDKGILYGVNRHNSSLIIFDRFSLPNYNSITFATSGAGKSYATKLEIIRTLMFDTEVIVIDPEREYEYLAEAVGGRYFNIALSSDHHINPFDLAIPSSDETPADVLRANTINLVGLFRIMLGGLTPEEDSIIDRAITETYALKDITSESNFANIEPPLLTDFEMVLAGMEGSGSIIQRLAKYTHGSWASFLNQPSNVDINRKFVVFSVRDMEDELKPVAMYIITHYIWNAVRKNIKKRLLVVDEAWWMMKSEDTASFLYSIAKRGRKYYLGLATITQDVGDFMKSPYGIPIVTNSSIQLLLKQSPSTIDVLQKTFNLTDEEKYLLLEADVGEGIFFAGLKHVAVKTIASYTEDQIITSDPSQILAIKKAKDDLVVASETPKSTINIMQ